MVSTTADSPAVGLKTIVIGGLPGSDLVATHVPARARGASKGAIFGAAALAAASAGSAAEAGGARRVAAAASARAQAIMRWGVGRIRGVMACSLWGFGV